MFTITKELKQGLKAADTINFRFQNGILTMAFIKEEKKNSKGWIKPEERKEYTHEYIGYQTLDNAWFNIMYAKSDTINALNYILKVGDVIYFQNMDNSNGYLRKSNLHHDELIARIYRKDKCIIERFVVTSSVCEDNTARAIQPA